MACNDAQQIAPQSACSEKRVKAVTGCTHRFPTAAVLLKMRCRKLSQFCGDDAIAALRITLIANALLELRSIASTIRPLRRILPSGPTP